MHDHSPAHTSLPRRLHRCPHLHLSNRVQLNRVGRLTALCTAAGVRLQHAEVSSRLVPGATQQADDLIVPQVGLQVSNCQGLGEARVRSAQLDQSQE